VTLEDAIRQAEAAYPKGWAVFESVVSPAELGMPTIGPDSMYAVAFRMDLDWHLLGPDVEVGISIYGDPIEAFLSLADNLRARR
jgi:hypothetical protein